MYIRQARLGDHRAIYQMVKNAFSGSRISDGQEQNWIIKQRGTKGYIPQLELVAENQGDIMGHILMTVHENRELTSLAPALYLALLSVSPMFQGQGVGSALIKKACAYGAALGYQAVFLVGDPA